MDGTKIVTGLVILSLTSGVGCKAKFTTKNKPSAQPTTSAAPTGGEPVASNPTPQGPPSGGPLVVAGPPSGYPPGGHPPVANPPVGRPTVVTQRPPTCTTGDDSSIDRSRPVQQQTIVFKRGKQMVWRKNCEGIVVSKKYEVLNGNTMKTVVIKPVGGAGAMSVFNRTSCHATSSQNVIQPAPTGEFKFQVSTQKSNHAMQVKLGQNLIDYAIGNERGTLILTVRLDETESDCIVISARGCEPKREASWTDSFHQQ